MKLLIVVDKLLTGFDAPSATYLYIDKDMRDHNLFQAICRVNRLGRDIKKDKDDPNSELVITRKEFGFIVDFKHLFNNLKEAVTNFNDPDGGLSGYDMQDIDGLMKDAINAGEKRLIEAIAAYDALRSDWEIMGLNNAEEVAAYYNPFPDTNLPENTRDKEIEEGRQRRMAFYAISQELFTAYAHIADHIVRAGFTEEEAEEIHKKVSRAMNLYARVRQLADEDFKVNAYDPQMRQLIDRYIRAEDAETIIPATADFSFLDLLSDTSDIDAVVKKAEEEADGKEAASDKIIARARAVINDWNAKDKATSVSFATRLQEIIDRIKKETEETTESIKQLLELLIAMKAERQQVPEGINTPFATALWNNRRDWTCIDGETETVFLLAHSGVLANFACHFAFRRVLWRGAVRSDMSA